MKKVAIIGGGAAGFFTAINLAEKNRNFEIHIFEASSKLLSKVLVSGGGRCNITNNIESVELLLRKYPRGFKELREVFSVFNNFDTIDWFNRHGVSTIQENDGRVFPAAGASSAVIDCFKKYSGKYNINIHTNRKAIHIYKDKSVIFNSENSAPMYFDFIVITTGGIKTADFISPLNLDIKKSVPSLFAFNFRDNPFAGLQGISVKNVQVRFQYNHKKVVRAGDILITHKGISGPVILKVSSFAARELNELNYNFKIKINWITEEGYDHHFEPMLKEKLLNFKEHNRNKNIHSTVPVITASRPEISTKPSQLGIPVRLWKRLCELAGIEAGDKWGSISNLDLQRLISILNDQEVEISSQTKNKEEFVTCGGVSLKEINFKTMESKICPGIFFAGEVLDIDGLTGGYNFQAAWSTAFIAANSICLQLKK